MAMDYQRFKQINDERLNYREMDDASVVSFYRNTGCGDGYRIYLKINEDDPHRRITDASYTTTGCGFGLAALAMATEWAKGKTLEAAELITAADIETMFEFPERRKNYPESAAAALRKAVADFRTGGGIKPEDRVSGTAALRTLKDQGHLREAKLAQVVLEGADLHGVDLEGADLRNSFLQRANLEGANLNRARLRGAYLNDANLSGADLRNADLRWAKLAGARIDGAIFDGALYDIGTRLDQKQTHILRVMRQEGKGLYSDSGSDSDPKKTLLQNPA